MHALRKLQQCFASDIWGEELSRLEGVILDGRFPAERLFQVYRNNFWIATEEALAGIYRVVKQLVGDAFFSVLVDHFLRSYPPRHGNMLQLGRDLPVFLCDFKPAEGLPYLSDVARLEWAYHEVFHAQESTAFDTRSLASIASDEIPRLRFRLAPSSRLIHSPYPVFEIWRVNQPGYDGDQSVGIDSGGDSILLARPELQVELQKLAPTDARFLQTLASGKNLARATETALEISRDFDLEVTLGRYLVTGTLILADENRSAHPRHQHLPGGKLS